MKRILFLILILVFTIPSFADDASQNDDSDAPAKLESSASVNLNSDNADDKGIGLSADIGLNSQFKLLAGLSYLKNSDSNNPFTTDSYNIGLGTDSAKKYSGDISIDNTKTPDVVTVSSLNGNFYWNPNKKWSVHLGPTFKKVQLYPAGPVSQEYDLSGAGLTVGAAFYGLKNWHFKVEGSELRLSKKTNEITFKSDSQASRQSFIQAAQSASVNRSTRMAEAGYAFKIMQLSLALEHDIAAIVLTESNTATLKSLWYIADDWDLMANVYSTSYSEAIHGSQDSAAGGDLTVTYYWQ